MSHVIYACDIGSTLKNAFGWARSESSRPHNSRQTGREIGKLVERLIHDLESTKSVALGFEAPLFIPIPAEEAQLSKARKGEDKSFSAQIGASVATLAVHQMAWIFRGIKTGFNRPLYFTLNHKEWPPKDKTQTLFCWEAFVSGKAKSENQINDHCGDAVTALLEFQALESQIETRTSVVTAESPLSLIGAAALWSGLSDNFNLLHQSAFVVKPEKIRTLE